LIVAANHLRCVRDGRLVFADVTIGVARGDALIVTGPNGSGKTSLLRILAGFLTPAGGTISLEAEASISLPERSHFVSHRDGLKTALTPSDHINFWLSLFARTSASYPDVDDILKSWRLDALRNIPCGALSAGQKRRVALARLSTAARSLWLLDEPTTALDSQAVELLNIMVARHRGEGGAVIAATHQPLNWPDASALDLGNPKAHSREAIGT
jgi:heme exporter protein A